MAAKERPRAKPRRKAPKAEAPPAADQAGKEEEGGVAVAEVEADAEPEPSASVDPGGRAAIAAGGPEGSVMVGSALGPRYLAYLAGLMLVIGLFERSDLLPAAGLYGLVGAMALVTAAAFGVALWQTPGEHQSPLTASNYLVPVMAVVVAGAVSVLVNDWRLHLGSQVLMAAAIFSATYVTLERFRGRRRPGHDFLQDAALILVLLGAYVAILAGVTDIFGRLALIFGVTFVAAYENLSRAAPGYGRPLVGGVIVAQVVTAVAFGLISYQFLDVARLGTILLVAWYVNRGMGYHMLEGTMSPGIFIEYVIGAVVCVVLVATAILTH